MYAYSVIFIQYLQLLMMIKCEWHCHIRRIEGHMVWMHDFSQVPWRLFSSQLWFDL